MQKLTTIREIFRNRDNYLGQTVEIGGWVRNIRDSKTFGFLVVNARYLFEPLQVVFMMLWRISATLPSERMAVL